LSLPKGEGGGRSGYAIADDYKVHAALFLPCRPDYSASAVNEILSTIVRCTTPAGGLYTSAWKKGLKSINLGRSKEHFASILNPAWQRAEKSCTRALAQKGE
ncbi:MAG: hypothetical protein ACRD1J_03175, partial [Terriglobia bacterium]